jgi:hypothetical protein
MFYKQHKFSHFSADEFFRITMLSPRPLLSLWDTKHPWQLWRSLGNYNYWHLVIVAQRSSKTLLLILMIELPVSGRSGPESFWPSYKYYVINLNVYTCHILFLFWKCVLNDKWEITSFLRLEKSAMFRYVWQVKIETSCPGSVKSNYFTTARCHNLIVNVDYIMKAINWEMINWKLQSKESTLKIKYLFYE